VADQQRENNDRSAVDASRSFSGDTHTRKPATIREYDIDLRRLFRILWDGKLLIAAITSVAAISAIIVALILPNIYRSEALLAPNSSYSGQGLAGLASQYEGLASLAGISLSGGADDKTEFGLAMLLSRKFIFEFVDKHDLLVPLMAAENWDPETGELVLDDSLYDSSAAKWVRAVDPPKKPEPSLQEAYEKFREILTVSRDKVTGFVTIAVEHYSPDIARQWVELLSADINKQVMQQDVAEAQQAIEYLNEQTELTQVTDLKNVFYRLIEEQTKTVVLSKVTDEYFLKTIDPPIAPEEKFRPSRAIIVILATFLAGMLACLIVLLRRDDKRLPAANSRISDNK